MGDRPWGFFETDALLVGEVQANARRGRQAEGERRLMLAVLRDALECYQKHAASTDPLGREQFEEAEAWLLEESVVGCFSFENICAILGIDPAWLRRRLQEWRNREVVARSPESGPAVVSPQSAEAVVAASRLSTARPAFLPESGEMLTP